MLYHFNITFSRTHKLYDLFVLLPDIIQDHVKSHVSFTYWPHRDFNLVLRELNDAFQFARYAHERNSLVLNTQGLFDIVAVLYEVARSQIEETTEDKDNGQ